MPPQVAVMEGATPQSHGCPQEDALQELSGMQVQPMTRQEDLLIQRQCTQAKGQALLKIVEVRRQAGLQDKHTHTQTKLELRNLVYADACARIP